MKLKWELFDDSDLPITDGSALSTIKIRRDDGYLYDWADNSFKQTGHINKTVNFQPMDTSNLPGYYERDVDSSNWSDQNYLAVADYSGGSIIRRGSQEFIIRNGKEFSINISDDVKDVKDEALGDWAFDPNGLTWTIYRLTGPILKQFGLTDTSATIPAIIARTTI